MKIGRNRGEDNRIGKRLRQMSSKSDFSIPSTAYVILDTKSVGFSNTSQAHFSSLVLNGGSVYENSAFQNELKPVLIFGYTSGLKLVLDCTLICRCS